jgi:hypothetical protein
MLKRVLSVEMAGVLRLRMLRCRDVWCTEVAGVLRGLEC